MVTRKSIRKIPKYMLDKIKNLDNKMCQNPCKFTRFYKYYTRYNKELCEVIVAVRNYHKKWFCKQVVVHAIHNDKCFLQDIGKVMNFYKVGWFRENISKYPKWYDYDWGWYYDKFFNINAPIVNKEFITTLSEYKYSAVNQFTGNNILEYLRFYEKYPQTELLVKAGLSNLATSKMILNKCAKDKKFCKWLYDNRDQAKNPHYYVSSIIRAYNQNKKIDGMYKQDRMKKEFGNANNFRNLKETFQKDEYPKLLDYLIKQKTDLHNYNDYFSACQFLNLDMTLDKNRYPKDFKSWHDIRTDQYDTQKAMQDEKERKALYEKFNEVALKYMPLQRNLNEDFVVILAKSPQDLVKEGECLHHCVGKMGYDQKFAREESLIFFVRYKNKEETPFVTLEYSLKTKNILQCYAEFNQKPQEEVTEFIHKKWLPYAKRKLKLII